jgi:hypothetical protein
LTFLLLVAHTEVLAAYVANPEVEREGSPQEVLKNFVGDNLIASEAGGRAQGAGFCDEKVLGRMLLLALCLATFCKESMIHAQKGVQ